MKQKEHTRKETETAEATPQKPILKPIYTFDNFVVGVSNQFAYTTGKSLCDSEVKVYTPLCIYGEMGVGKTHLLQAVAHCGLEKGSSVVYLSAEVFMNEFADHLRRQAMDRFRDRYRNCDLLIIDDIQYLNGKEQNQKELMHTLEARQNSRRQTLLGADRSPIQFSRYDQRLQSLLLQGMVVEIQPIEKEMRLEIIRKKCAISQVDLDEEIVDFIASLEEVSPREIEGIIVKLHALSQMLEMKMTLAYAQEALRYLTDDDYKYV